MAEPTDRYVPTEHQGELEPNHFCRAWNSKRSKYCRARAGQGTDHVGIGRCKNHGGASPVKHGRMSKTKRVGLGELIEKHEANPDPLRLTREIAIVRAIMDDFLERAEASREAAKEGEAPALNPALAIGHAEAVSRIVKRIEDIRAQDAISRPELIRVMAEMGRNAEHRIGQLARRVAELVQPEARAHLEELFSEARESIAEDWNRIQVA